MCVGGRIEVRGLPLKIFFVFLLFVYPDPVKEAISRTNQNFNPQQNLDCHHSYCALPVHKSEIVHGGVNKRLMSQEFYIVLSLTRAV